MTYDELRDYIDKFDAAGMVEEPAVAALRAVVELHKPTNGYDKNICLACSPEMPVLYPCPTIKAIEKELQ